MKQKERIEKLEEQAKQQIKFNGVVIDKMLKMIDIIKTDSEFKSENYCFSLIAFTLSLIALTIVILG